ncbi:hypothetical protein [Curtobacterium sp. ISL-83]|uniref:hypothetical protein n=1 Tax=Curtobacterium sp. ISL-83 TaxID=2819145 RepID=UPI001BEBADCF|nr:hypothetical protein [Curtobacterium sp. ISL-83]MBT2502995.1 hypothetical protein [Curtobacterium sp. ISL-83]
MTVNTAELRASARIIDPGFPGTAKAITAAADELDLLHAALAAVPHSTFCEFMTAAYGEPCSCPKSLTPYSALPSSTEYPTVTRLEVHGPAGRVVGLLGLAGVLVALQDDGRTLKVIYEQKEPTT